MDVQSLSPALDHLSSSGIVLSTERRVSLDTSLTLLMHAEKLKQVKYWGRIQGVAADYHIAQGSNDDGYATKSFYSMDCIRWAQLPEIHPVLAKSCAKIRGRFTGNPSHEFTVEAIRSEETKGDGSIVVTTTITEEKRLAAAVAAIDKETRIVPRGAYRMTPSDVVERNHGFGGLSHQAAGKIESYMHFRQPITLLSKSPLERARMDQGLDFMDSISDDIPKNCWSIQYQNGSKAVVLRSLIWPGFVFFHTPNSPLFGHAYVGTGQRNNDLIFELP
ncbi:hypothetical protein PTSG_01527 [Salpingoeca rosetta]|uniref:Radial spoke head protein 9 homolog n=1 Tax=Salpingoeca rosetta (strain ATCC 50818 / BSB-021) TaxID=946362 RepID=F2U0L6_SALR5|nr:uncharacterized protein PTSG_01527 [Salpingoeca rosetta]EGD80944.1 hypothetical protein PTSG_01527 [Salpingoeca rosetta]|eukprot:XP_004997505.1 hypothetical protein PTSG_01527 [Salpingoeca rosetta]